VVHRASFVHLLRSPSHHRRPGSLFRRQARAHQRQRRSIRNLAKCCGIVGRLGGGVGLGYRIFTALGARASSTAGRSCSQSAFWSSADF